MKVLLAYLLRLAVLRMARAEKEVDGRSAELRANETPMADGKQKESNELAEV